MIVDKNNKPGLFWLTGSKGSNSTPLKSRVFIAYKRFLAYPYLAVYGQWLQLIKTHERLFLTKQERENLDTSLSVVR